MVFQGGHEPVRGLIFQMIQPLVEPLDLESGFLMIVGALFLALQLALQAPEALRFFNREIPFSAI